MDSSLFRRHNVSGEGCRLRLEMDAKKKLLSDEVGKWFSTNRLKINTPKTATLEFGHFCLEQRKIFGNWGRCSTHLETTHLMYLLTQHPNTTNKLAEAFLSIFCI